jgi:hypothetical protein
MSVRRSLALLLLIAALVLVGLEAVGAWYQGIWEIIPLSSLWAAIDRNSLIGLQAGIENNLWPGLWPPVRTVLELPVWAVAAILGVLLLVTGSNRAESDRRRRFSRRR